MKLYNVPIGRIFVYDNAMFLMSDYSEKYQNYASICLASNEDLDQKYFEDNRYFFDESVEVEMVDYGDLKKLIDKYSK